MLDSFLAPLVDLELATKAATRRYLASVGDERSVAVLLGEFQEANFEFDKLVGVNPHH